MDALDNLAKIYVKYYICQIHSSVCYLKYKKHKKALESNLIFFSDHNVDGSDFNLQLELPKSVSQKKIKSHNEDVIMKYEDDNDYEDEDEKEKFPKKLFVYKNKIFSRVEIQGIVVQIQTRGNDAAKERKIVYIDDTTGIIQCLIWKNKMPNSFDHIEKLFGTYIRVLGQADYYQAKFEIIADRIQPVTKASNELLFHTTLLQNQKAIFEVSINELNKKAFNDLDNTNYNMTTSLTTITNTKNSSSSGTKVSTQETEVERLKKYDKALKEYANCLLVYCQSFKFEGGQDDSFGFTKVSIDNFMEDNHVKEMLRDFCAGYNHLKFITDLFNKVLEPNSLGKIIYGSEEGLLGNYVEIKHDNAKLKNDICNFIRKKTEDDFERGANINEIYSHIISLYNGFYTEKYLNFTMTRLVLDGVILSIGTNTYTINI